MKNTIHKPHDSLFRNYLSNIKIAKTFFKVYLPADVKPLCDFSTLKLEAGSFVEKNLRQHFSDILYSVQINGERGYIYPLIAHQTTPRRMDPLSNFWLHPCGNETAFRPGLSSGLSDAIKK